MEGVFKTTSIRSDNPKWTHEKTGISVSLTRNKQEEETGKASLFIGAKGLPVSEITGNPKQQDRHSLRLGTIYYDAYEDIFTARLSHVISLHKQGKSVFEICEEIYLNQKNNSNEENSENVITRLCLWKEKWDKNLAEQEQLRLELETIYEDMEML